MFTPFPTPCSTIPYFYLFAGQFTRSIANHASLSVVQATIPGTENLGYRFWIIWAVICFSFVPITYFLYPETANRTLEDIDRFFATKPGVIVAFNKEATQLHRPERYIEEDERIAMESVEKGSGGMVDEEKGVDIAVRMEERVGERGL